MSIQSALIVVAMAVLAACSSGITMPINMTVQVDDKPKTKPESVKPRELSLISLFMTHFLEQDEHQATTASASTAPPTAVALGPNTSDLLPESNALSSTIRISPTATAAAVVDVAPSKSPTMVSLQNVITW